jgi:hypothetical protein
MAYSSVTVGNTATLLVAANTARLSLVIENNGSVTVYLGPDTSVSSSNGIPLLADGSFQEDSGGARMYQGDIYGVTASDTSDVRVWERIR